VTRVSLPDKIVAISRALSEVPHAFGGAIALGYHAEPRATIDIDLNAFVRTDRAAHPLDLLHQLGADVTGARELAEREGQVRVFWHRTPIDLFFSYDPFHDAAERDAYEVPFADTTIQILSATHLTVCKAVFDRPKDWVDIESMLALRTRIDPAEALRWVGRIAGDTDPRFVRLAEVLAAPR